MPKASVNGITLYYETAGAPDAPPLLLISGLSAYTAGWGWQVPDLARDFHVVAFDNRGAGQSSYPTPGYTLDDMADDAAGLLTALGIKSAHVFGVSQGGMIAQHFVLCYPQRVRRLALGCTTAGGASMIPPLLEVATAMLSPTSSDRGQQFLNSLWYLVGPSALQDKPAWIQEVVVVTRRNPQTLPGLIGQLQAMNGHDVASELHRIAAPTLVMHGKDDVLLPPENGRLLAERIPQARLRLYADAGHLFMIEKAAAVNADLKRFFLDSTE